MDDLRSNTYRNNRMQLEVYSGAGKPNGLQDFRSYSASYANSVATQPPISALELRKGKSTDGSISKAWSFSDPEMKRKRRVASYKAYSVEGKMKGGFRKSFRWIKERYYQMIHGW